MTVAAGLALGAGVHAKLGLGQPVGVGLGKMPGAALPATATAGSGVLNSTESFRANWLRQLATMDSEPQSEGETGSSTAGTNAQAALGTVSTGQAQLNASAASAQQQAVHAWMANSQTASASSAQAVPRVQEDLVEIQAALQAQQGMSGQPATASDETPAKSLSESATSDAQQRTKQENDRKTAKTDAAADANVTATPLDTVANAQLAMVIPAAAGWVAPVWTGPTHAAMEGGASDAHTSLSSAADEARAQVAASSYGASPASTAAQSASLPAQSGASASLSSGRQLASSFGATPSTAESRSWASAQSQGAAGAQDAQERENQGNPIHGGQSSAASQTARVATVPSLSAADAQAGVASATSVGASAQVQLGTGAQPVVEKAISQPQNLPASQFETQATLADSTTSASNALFQASVVVQNPALPANPAPADPGVTPPPAPPAFASLPKMSIQSAPTASVPQPAPLSSDALTTATSSGFANSGVAAAALNLYAVETAAASAGGPIGSAGAQPSVGPTLTSSNAVSSQGSAVLSSAEPAANELPASTAPTIAATTISSDEQSKTASSLGGADSALQSPASASSALARAGSEASPGQRSNPLAGAVAYQPVSVPAAGPASILSAGVASVTGNAVVSGAAGTASTSPDFDSLEGASEVLLAATVPTASNSVSATLPQSVPSAASVSAQAAAATGKGASSSSSPSAGLPATVTSSSVLEGTLPARGSGLARPQTGQRSVAASATPRTAASGLASGQGTGLSTVESAPLAASAATVPADSSTPSIGDRVSAQRASAASQGRGENLTQAQPNVQAPEAASSLLPNPGTGQELATAAASQASQPVEQNASAPRTESGGRRGAVLPASRPTRAASAPAAAGQATGATVGQAGMQVLNPAGLAVNQPTVHGASLSSTQSGGNTGAGGGVSETFSALDASPTAGRPSWVQAGAQHAEAGFQDPSLGWVGVRADLSGGAIHAAIVPGSAEASQTLGGHMAGLNAYLSEQHTSVGSVTLASPQGRDSFSNGDGGMNQGMQQGSGQQAGQGTAAESATVPEGSAPVNAGVASFSGPTQTTGVVLAFEPQAAEGSSISVLA